MRRLYYCRLVGFAAVGLVVLWAAPLFRPQASPSPPADFQSAEESVFWIPLLVGSSETMTGIAVTNPSAAPATLVFEAYDSDGKPLGSGAWDQPEGKDPDGVLLPGHQRALNDFEIFDIDLSLLRQGWIRIRSNNPAVKVVYQYVRSDLSALDGMNAVVEPQRRLFYPWVLEAWPNSPDCRVKTMLSLVNPGDEPAEIRITPRNPAGQAAAEPWETRLPPLVALQGSPNDWFPGVTDPIILEVETLTGPGLVGSEWISHGGTDPFFVVSNALAPSEGAFTLYSAQLASWSGMRTFVCVMNPDDESQSITIRARSEAGNLLGNVYQGSLSPHGFLLGDAAELLAFTGEAVGTLELRAERAPVIGSVIFGDPSAGYAAALPLEAPVQGGVLFPHVAHLPGFFTGLAFHIVGTDPTRLGIQVWDRNGERTATGPRDSTPEGFNSGSRLSQVLSELTGLALQAGGFIQVHSSNGALVSQELFGTDDLSLLSAVPGYPHSDKSPADIPLSEFIVVDQFGYLPDAQKVAVIRDPLKGFDKEKEFTPGPLYAVVETTDGRWIYTGEPTVWKEDDKFDPSSEDQSSGFQSSGDRAWWFDFSSLTKSGEYYVLDVARNVRSPVFQVADTVYREVLKHAVRTFFYQRAGYPKQSPYADEGWTDAASHLGRGQDAQCRSWFKQNDPATERDLSGGWYDAGDYNKYTNWTASYIIELLRAYEENPEAFGDDYRIPESDNGIPDVVDEALWGLAWLVKMQNEDGSLLSVMGLSHASPPSDAKGPSYYGDPNTSATLSGAAAFAYSAKVLRKLGRDELNDYAEELVGRAVRAWNWAEKNPKVLFYNNSPQDRTQGLAAGQQEVDDYGRLVKKLAAACYLYETTGDTRFREYFDSNYAKTHLLEWTFAYPFEQEVQDVLLYYMTVPDATSSVVDKIRSTYQTAMEGDENTKHNFFAIRGEEDPYRAYLKDYTWGSNGVKARQGTMFYSLISYGIEPTDEARHAAERYIHYLHGVNPLGMVYLSNMYAYGAERAVNEFYHSWFTDGSTRWDRVGVSTYGPAPGFLTGGPYPSYDWDGCCPSRCGSSSNNSKCFAEPISPPKGQPPQKSYKDFNTGWPLNSWSVTENSCGYQSVYIRLLSKFVRR